MAFRSTLLIVDDEAVGREILEDLLITQGYRLAFASSGVEALDKAVQLRPDLVLLDVMMPGMDGFEVCRRFRAHPLLADVPVLMVTALDDRDSRLRGIEAGADDFIAKPFDRLELRTRVRTITRLNRYRRLLAERSKFQWVVDQAREGYLLLDGAGLILYANAQARRWLGIPDGESNLSGESFLSLASRAYQCQPREVWQAWPELESPEAGTAPRYLIRSESPATAAVWLQVDQLATGGGTAEAYLVRLQDITAHMINQGQMWSFHTQVHHKLRSSVTLVTGSLQLVEELLPNLSVQDLSEFVSAARQQAMRLQNQILEVIRFIDASDLTTQSQDCVRASDLTLAVDEITSSLGLANVHLIYKDLKAPDAYPIFISRQALELILWELLENARKFHPRNAPGVDIEIAPHADGIRLSVQDDGHHLTPEQLARIWTPYYQAEKYFTGQTPGMGLGLPMVAALVWSVGGTCRLRNRDDRAGIVVELVLPVAANGSHR